MRFAASHLFAAVAVLITISISSAVAQVAVQPWQSAGVLQVPKFYYTFVSTNTSGDLLAATFNRGEPNDPPKPIPALLIRNPTSEAPSVIELCRVPFDSTRGYGGIAADAGGAFFVSGDTGKAETSFVLKFGPDAKPDPQFGQQGRLLPNRRCLGIEVFGNFLLLAVDWGQVIVMDAKTGRLMGQTSQTPQPRFVRDIAIDPRSMRIFGVASAGVVSWGGAAPWSPTSYTFRELRRPQTTPIVAEGISVDPFKRTVLINPPDGGQLLEVFGDGRIVPATVSTAVPKRSHLTDTAISADGSTLFISDYKQELIHVMRRPAPDVAARNEPVAPAAPAASAPVAAPKLPPVKWSKSYFEVLPAARQARQPMIVYFRRAGVKPCERFEKETLLTDEFNSRAKGFANVFEEAAPDSILRVRFGVVRLPTLFLLDGDGNTVGEWRGTIPPAQLFAAMDKVRGQVKQ
jgi:hypothetical protein